MRISISLELAEYLLDRHMDCVLDDLGFEVPDGIDKKIVSLRRSINRVVNRQRVRAKIESLSKQEKTRL